MIINSRCLLWISYCYITTGQNTCISPEILGSSRQQADDCRVLKFIAIFPTCRSVTAVFTVRRNFPYYFIYCRLGWMKLDSEKWQKHDLLMVENTWRLHASSTTAAVSGELTGHIQHSKHAQIGQNGKQSQKKLLIEQETIEHIGYSICKESIPMLYLVRGNDNILTYHSGDCLPIWAII